ncbi:MAG: hypothetical protein Q8O19_06135 [Rectinemataceae bacterium]|nr:hypothetical protein [Rectinemataceae bacterium]
MTTNNKKPMSFDRKLIILFAGILTFVCGAAIAADTLILVPSAPITDSSTLRSSAP